MRIGLFADTHGNISALRAVMTDGHEQGVEQWLCLGDIAFRGPAPAECLRAVMDLDGAVAVMGNTEEWLPVGPPAGEGGDEQRRAAIRLWWEWTIDRLAEEEVHWVRSLPKQQVVPIRGRTLLGLHATAQDLEHVLPPWATPEQVRAALPVGAHAAIACAHVHLPYLRRVDGTTVINPGSAGRPVDDDPRAAYAVLEIEPAHMAVEFRRIDYDIDEIARFAHQRGFPWAREYEDALRTGRNF